MMKTSFSNFIQCFQTCQETFFPLLDESLIVKGSQVSTMYLSRAEASTLNYAGDEVVMFAPRGGWNMHLLPQLRVRSSAADLSVKSQHKNMCASTSQLL